MKKASVLMYTQLNLSSGVVSLFYDTHKDPDKEWFADVNERYVC